VDIGQEIVILYTEIFTPLLTNEYDNYYTKIKKGGLCVDQELSRIIDRCWESFVKFRDRVNSSIVKPSIPILWFGDLEEYQKLGNKKIVTLAINPSNEEFRLNANSNSRFDRFNQGREIWFKDYLNNSEKELFIETLNNYYRIEPYEWFYRLETPLNYIGSTYGGKMQSTSFSSCAIHIDLCPLSTSDKWRDVPSDIKNEMKADGEILLTRLLQYLEPDIILASISAGDLKSIFNLRAKKDAQVRYENDKGGFIRKYNYRGIELIVGRNMHGTPFGAMTNNFIKEGLEKVMRCNQSPTDN
jgi:hypothetical protein